MSLFLGQLAIPTIANCSLNEGIVQLNSSSDISPPFRCSSHKFLTIIYSSQNIINCQIFLEYVSVAFWGFYYCQLCLIVLNGVIQKLYSNQAASADSQFDLIWDFEELSIKADFKKVAYICPWMIGVQRSTPGVFNIQTYLSFAHSLAHQHRSSAWILAILSPLGG